MMSTVPIDPETLEEARRGLQAALDLEGDLERRLGVAAAIQTAVADLGLEAVVVGGTAVEFWTEGDFTTFDIDALLPASDDVQATLQALGFERRSGRHWTLPGHRIAVEFPGNSLTGSKRSVAVDMPTGQAAFVLSLEDALVQRLHEFLATGDFDATVQAIAMMGSPQLDSKRLSERAAEENLQAALVALKHLAERVQGGEEVSMHDVHLAADDAMRKRRPYS